MKESMEKKRADQKTALMHHRKTTNQFRSRYSGLEMLQQSAVARYFNNILILGLNSKTAKHEEKLDEPLKCKFSSKSKDLTTICGFTAKKSGKKKIFKIWSLHPFFAQLCSTVKFSLIKNNLFYVYFKILEFSGNNFIVFPIILPIISNFPE